MRKLGRVEQKVEHGWLGLSGNGAIPSKFERKLLEKQGIFSAADVTGQKGSPALSDVQYPLSSSCFSRFLEVVPPICRFNCTPPIRALFVQ